MNIQQFQYVLAVAEWKHFETAAEKCHITQSTLSTMISRLESEIGIKIFDRKTKPLTITQEGIALIKQIKIITKEIDALIYKAEELKGTITGELNIGIIPTVAPYLLPLFLSRFAKQFPDIKVIVHEITTKQIIRKLKNRTIDIGIAATPLLDSVLIEYPLYNEQFVLFDCHTDNVQPITGSINDINLDQLWLLQEGHCLKTQVEAFCNISNQKEESSFNLEFKAGSLDSLIRFVKANNGITLLPQLAVNELQEGDKARLSYFKPPVPVRSIGLLVHQHYVKKQLLDELKTNIKDCVDNLLPTIHEQTLLNPL